MKRLDNLELTAEDVQIWLRVDPFPLLSKGPYSTYDSWWGRAHFDDRRDADLMFWLVKDEWRGKEIWLRIGAENRLVPVVHVLIKKNPLWPSGPTLARSWRKGG